MLCASFLMHRSHVFDQTKYTLFQVKQLLSNVCYFLPTIRSLAAIVSENALFSLFPIEKPKLPNLTLP